MAQKFAACVIVPYNAVVDALTPDRQRSAKLKELSVNPTATSAFDFLAPNVLFDDNKQTGIVMMYEPNSPLRVLLNSTVYNHVDLLLVIRSLIRVDEHKPVSAPSMRYMLFAPFAGLPRTLSNSQRVCHLVYCDMLYRMHVFSLVSETLAEQFMESEWVKPGGVHMISGVRLTEQLFLVDSEQKRTALELDYFRENISFKQLLRASLWDAFKDAGDAGPIFGADLDLLHSNQGPAGKPTVTNNSLQLQFLDTRKTPLLDPDDTQTPGYDPYRYSYMNTFQRQSGRYYLRNVDGGGMCFFHSLWDQLMTFVPDFFVDGRTSHEQVLARKWPAILTSAPPLSNALDKRLIFLQKLFLRDMAFVKFVEFGTTAASDADKFESTITILDETPEQKAIRNDLAAAMHALFVRISGSFTEAKFNEACNAIVREAMPWSAGTIRAGIMDWYNSLIIEELTTSTASLVNQEVVDISEEDVSFRADKPLDRHFVYHHGFQDANDVATFHDKMIYDLVTRKGWFPDNETSLLRELFVRLEMVDPDVSLLLDDAGVFKILNYHDFDITAMASLVYKIVFLTSRLMSASFAELCYTRSYVGTNHFVAVTEALQVNLFVFTPNRDGYLDINLSSVIQEGIFNCCMHLGGGGTAGHFVPIEFRDEEYVIARKAPLHRYADADINILQRHARRYPFDALQLLSIKQERWLTEARFALQTGDATSVLKEHLFIASTYSYFQHPNSMMIFFEVFFKLIARNNNNTSCLLDRIRLVHKIINDMGLANIRSPQPHLQLPYELGFISGEFISLPNRSDALHRLIFNVALEARQAMYTAAVLTAYFMYVPPVITSNQTLNHTNLRSVHPTGRLYAAMQASLATYTGARVGVGNELESLRLFREKTLMFGITMRSALHQSVINLCKTGILYRPYLLKYTAFFEFYSVLLDSMFKAINRTSSAALIDFNYVHVNAPMKKSAPHDPWVFDLSVRIAHVIDKNPIPGNRRGYVLAWFTKSASIVHKELQRHEDSNDMARFLHGTRISFAEVDMWSEEAVRIPFEFDKLELDARSNSVFLHLAVYIKEDCKEVPHQVYDIRHGHTFVALSDIPNGSFLIKTWEGPISTRLSVENNDKHALAKGMQYEGTFVLDVQLSVGGPRKHNRASGSIMFDDAPNTMFTKDEMSVVSQFLVGMNQTFDAHVVNMHSLLYVNFPMENNVIPLWSVMYLPPFEVEKQVLANRLAMILQHEDITENDFLHIALLAFRGKIFSELEQREWMPEHHFDVDETLREFARQRFIWIFTQVVNPFNQIVYRSDIFHGISTEQMGYPVCGFGDCEDTCEGVIRLIRGLQRIPSTRADRGLHCILAFLNRYTACMCVLTTNGAAYGRPVEAGMRPEEEDRRFYDENTKVSLHMMALLVPRHVIDRDLPANGVSDGCIPVETTGLNFNSYATPEALVPRETLLKYPFLAAAIVRYNEVCTAAAHYEDVANENINYATLINSESAPTAQDKGWSFVKPAHYFYGRFISMCHSQEGVEQGKFLDFFYEGHDKPGVRFHHVINPRGDGGAWELQAPAVLRKNHAMQAKLEHICRVFAANVQPIPNLRDGAVQLDKRLGDAYTGDKMARHQGDESIPSEIRSLQMRAVCFYINAAHSTDAYDMMARFKVYMEKQNVGEVGDVTTWSTLGGALHTFVLQIKF